MHSINYIPKKRQKIYEIITELCIWSEKLCYFMETCNKSKWELSYLIPKLEQKIVYSNKIVTKLLKSVNQASLYDIDRIVYYPWSENKK